MIDAGSREWTSETVTRRTHVEPKRPGEMEFPHSLGALIHYCSSVWNERVSSPPSITTRDVPWKG